MDKEREKQLAAEAAVGMVEDGMMIGLGTGSTAAYALRALGRRIRDGLKMQGLPSSAWAREFAAQEGIPVIGWEHTTRLDLALDGADEFDPALNLIKGGGGALFREKIVASAADRVVIFADSSKRVAHLGAFPLPVEVNVFGWQATAERIRGLGVEPVLRGGEATPFMTDNENYILDCPFRQIDDPAALEAQIRAVTGVVECGLFVGMVDALFVAEGESVQRLAPPERH